MTGHSTTLHYTSEFLWRSRSSRSCFCFVLSLQKKKITHGKKKKKGKKTRKSNDEISVGDSDEEPIATRNLCFLWKDAIFTHFRFQSLTNRHGVTQMLLQILCRITSLARQWMSALLSRGIFVSFSPFGSALSNIGKIYDNNLNLELEVAAITIPFTNLPILFS